MVKLTRIYTRGGDKGMTSLGSGARVAKADARIQAIGEVDEANAAVGWAREAIRASMPVPAVDALLATIQNDLFDLGADLCIPGSCPAKGDAPENALRIVPSQVIFLENKIDEINGNLAPLNSFILPGGSLASAALHLARTVVRRAERALVKLQDAQPLNEEALKYINRLSDLLFVMCRHVNGNGKDDVLWVPGKSGQ